MLYASCDLQANSGEAKRGKTTIKKREGGGESKKTQKIRVERKSNGRKMRKGEGKKTKEGKTGRGEVKKIRDEK